MLVSLLAGCQGIAPEPRPVSSGHVNTKAASTPAASNIPAPVHRTPFVPKPVAEAPVETYTVVVNDVPVKELLFALARDAAINVDIHPDVSGQVTINAVDQSLAQILDRVARQLDLRYEMNGDNISIQMDTPFVRIYRVDYVNLTREATTNSSVSTDIASTSSSASDSGGGGGGGGANNSNTTVTSSTSYPFWDTLVETVRNLVSGRGTFEGLDEEETVIANPANGVLMVRASGVQHEEVQRYLDEVRAASRRQVLIEVTIVEVQLSDGYSAGIDWSSLAADAGLSIAQNFAGGVAAGLDASPFFALEYANSRDVDGNPNGDLTASVRLLKEFGDTRVLSSPKIMALNNQTALLKVVQNIVYFEVSSDTVTPTTGGATTSTDTTAKSVSVGVVMSVTPQINETDEVTLIIRPTISRVLSFVQDPNPLLFNPTTNESIPNEVPQIAVREMESVLRIGSGQLAVLGGLMTDDVKKDSDGVPWLSDSQTFGDLFTSRNNQFEKTELVIFLRPWVVQSPDVQADLKSFQPFLPENIDPSAEPVKSRFAKDLP